MVVPEFEGQRAYHVSQVDLIDALLERLSVREDVEINGQANEYELSP